MLNCAVITKLMTSFGLSLGFELLNNCVTVSGQSTEMKADIEVGALNGFANAAFELYYLNTTLHLLYVFSFL